MIRTTSRVGAALVLVGALVTATFGLASTASNGTAKAAAQSAQLSALPTNGSYAGVDHAGRTITFSFHGNYMSHFMVNHTVIGGAHVSNGAWHETCHNGMCTKGSWVSDTHVKGSWRYGGSSHWVAFDARTAPPVAPYAGTYLGRDHSGLRVHFSFHAGKLTNFAVDHNLVGDASVSHGRFDVCHQSICYRGHWETDTIVVGTWRYSNSDQWRQWEAYAYAH